MTDPDTRTDQPADGPEREANPGSSPSPGRGRRDVVVPMRVYKTVTVFSTLIAVFAVVLGFVLLDAATLQVSLLRSAITGLLGLVGVQPPSGVLSGTLAVLGLLVIAGGAGVYVVGTRFRAEGMGKSQEDANEGSDNG